MIKSISLNVRGKLGAQIFQKMPLDGFVRAWVVGANPRTAPQQQQRSKLALAVRAWRALSVDDQAAWIPAGNAAHLSAYHAFLRWYLTQAAPIDLTIWRTDWDTQHTVWDWGRTQFRTSFDAGQTIFE